LPLSWLNDLLLQRVQLDTPETERLHDGTSISCAMSEVDVCAAHQRDGLPILKPSLPLCFDWLRDPAQPALWRAQSEPLKGQRLIWTLSKPAREELGETAAYNLQWGERHLPGTWALEHVIVQGRWADSHAARPCTDSRWQRQPASLGRGAPAKRGPALARGAAGRCAVGQGRHGRSPARAGADGQSGGQGLGPLDRILALASAVRIGQPSGKTRLAPALPSVNWRPMRKGAGSCCRAGAR
jgi:hypothetical protein